MPEPSCCCATKRSSSICEPEITTTSAPSCTHVHHGLWQTHLFRCSPLPKGAFHPKPPILLPFPLGKWCSGKYLEGSRAWRTRGESLASKCLLREVRNYSMLLMTLELTTLAWTQKSAHISNKLRSSCQSLWFSLLNFCLSLPLHTCCTSAQAPRTPPSLPMEASYSILPRGNGVSTLGFRSFLVMSEEECPVACIPLCQYSGGNGKKFWENFLLRKLESFPKSAADFRLQTLMSLNMYCLGVTLETVS